MILFLVQIFIRLEILKLKSVEINEKLVFSKTINDVSIDNPSPYHVSFVDRKNAGNTFIKIKFRNISGIKLVIKKLMTLVY